MMTLYEDAARLTREMLDAARAQQWDEVVAKEKLCAEKLAKLPSTAPMQDLKTQRRKFELIGDMLSHNAEIRVLAEPRLACLSELIGSTRQQSRLNRTYRS